MTFQYEYMIRISCKSLILPGFVTKRTRNLSIIEYFYDFGVKAYKDVNYGHQRIFLVVSIKRYCTWVINSNEKVDLLLLRFVFHARKGVNSPYKQLRSQLC